MQSFKVPSLERRLKTLVLLLKNIGWNVKNLNRIFRPEVKKKGRPKPPPITIIRVPVLPQE